MNTYLDYLKWRGDLSFKQDKINYVDYIILCELLYADFENAFFTADTVTIAEAGSKTIEGNKHNMIYESYELAKTLINVDRFKDLEIYNYVIEYNREKNIQFGAMMIDISEDETIVVFQGTDDSLTGWKEDLMIAYTKISSMDWAVDYLNKHLKQNRKYHVIGHSKGGMLAIYASVFCEKNTQDRIMRVINFDGPGIPDNLFDAKRYELIKDRYVKVVVYEDVIGTIFYRDENTMVVKTKGPSYLENHDLPYWCVDANKLEQLDDVSNRSKLIRKNIAEFFNKTGDIQRKEFVEALFNALFEEDVLTLSGLIESGMVLYLKLLRRFIFSDLEFKETAIDLLKVVYDAFAEDAQDSIKDAGGDLKEKIDELLNKIKK